MLVRNKWSGKTYKVVLIQEDKVTLQRENGTTFTIAKKEYNFSYIPLDKVN